MLKSKIHRATITHSNLNYDGSISIDKKLMSAAYIYPYEKVDILNINNGERFSTYAVESEIDGEICLNGAAARKGLVGDLIIIITYSLIDYNRITINNWKPDIIKVGKNNKVIN
jgi:aspartate 1-decarboxylase